MGPEGGSGGGQLLIQGKPEEIITKNIGITSQFLKSELKK